MVYADSQAMVARSLQEGSDFDGLIWHAEDFYGDAELRTQIREAVMGYSARKVAAIFIEDGGRHSCCLLCDIMQPPESRYLFREFMNMASYLLSSHCRNAN